MDRVYIAIDLKSFYASVECRERNLNPLTTNLVVADISRTEKTICLAVSPSLKEYGLPGRARLFEVNQAVREINKERRKNAPNHTFKGKTSDNTILKLDPSMELDFIIATPQMLHYMKKSAEIYNIYLKYIASDDIHVYSIDEVFMDITAYLKTYKKSPREIAKMIIKDVYKETGITATAGIGTNLYLAKVAMDIVAKHIPADRDGVRIAELDEYSYRKNLWDHKPLTDFWRVGRGYITRLARHGLFTMGDIARKSLEDEDSLYEEFGINAELLIDHAWGYESCTMKDIKSYVPDNNSLSSGQVLDAPYDYKKALVIVKEMADNLSLDLTNKGLLTNQIALSIGYDVIDLEDYKGELKKDYIGREMPKMAHSSISLGRYSASSSLIRNAAIKIFNRIMDKKLHMRRVYIVACSVIKSELIDKASKDYEQLNLFMDYEEVQKEQELLQRREDKELEAQKVMLEIKNRFGKNSILTGTNLEEGAKSKERNEQIGGHKA